MNTGEELYMAYAEHLLTQFNTGVDAWEDLTEEEQSAWEAVARKANGEA